MRNKITIHIKDWYTCSGAQLDLYLDPENCRVYDYSYIGHHTYPIKGFHKIHLHLLNIDKNTVNKKLLEWLEHETQQKLLMKIVDCYRDTRWDGNNYVGYWCENETDLLDELERQYSDAELPCYWDAGDYLGGDVECIEDVLENGLQQTAKDLTDEALLSDCHVRSSDMEKELINIVEQEIVKLEGQNNDISSKNEKRLAALQKAVA